LIATVGVGPYVVVDPEQSAAYSHLQSYRSPAKGAISPQQEQKADRWKLIACIQRLQFYRKLL
jgi:hypothetical protein